jgi:hypothetical protein
VIQNVPSFCFSGTQHRRMDLHIIIGGFQVSNFLYRYDLNFAAGFYHHPVGKPNLATMQNGSVNGEKRR